MLTNSKDFTIRLKKIKAEVLAIKQAHKYGLNRTDFSSILIQEPQSSRSISFRLILYIDTNSSSQPYIDFGTIDLFTITTWQWDGTNKTLTINGNYLNSYPSQSGYITALSVICVKYIINYSWEEIV